MEGQIPIIDMHENNDTNKVGVIIREACEKWGCFRVINHGVPAKLTAEIKSVGFDLFDRTVEIKQKIKEIIPGSGYAAPTQQNPVFEGLGLDITSPQSLPSFLDDLRATPMQRETIEKYTQAIDKLGNDIVSTILEDYPSNVGITHFRLNKYDITHDRLGSDGLPLHTDGSLLTILQDDETHGGLEIASPNGDIIPAHCFPGSLFVILGDAAVPWSNGKFIGGQHRVVCNDVGLRLSIASAITPKIDEDIHVHPKFIEDGHLPKYIPFKIEDLRKLRASNKFHGGQVPDHFYSAKTSITTSVP